MSLSLNWLGVWHGGFPSIQVHPEASLVNMKLVLFLWALLTAFVDAISLTSTGSTFTVDAGSNPSFQFTVQKANCDVTSIKFNGQEAQSGTPSHIASGLGSATVSANTITCMSKSSIYGQSLYETMELISVISQWCYLYQDHLRYCNFNTLLCYPGQR